MLVMQQVTAQAGPFAFRSISKRLMHIYSVCAGCYTSDMEMGKLAELQSAMHELFQHSASAHSASFSVH